MPQYSYQHPNGRVIDIYQSMNESHEVWKDEDGVEWKRVWEKPNAVIDGVFNIDPNDRNEFVRKTGMRKGKMNDLFQLSAELSEKRAAKEGVDQVKLKSWESYEKSRVRGTEHPERKREKLKQAFAKSKHFEYEP